MNDKFLNKKITPASQDMVDEFESETNEILIAIGHPEAFVTDESQVSDFLFPFLDKMSLEERNEILREERKIMQKIEELLKRPVGPRELLGDLAKERYMIKKENKSKMRPH